VQVDSPKRLNILYDDVERHYNVKAILNSAMPKKDVCKGFNKACTSDVTHACDQTCSDCLVCPSCAEYKRHFRSRTCFANHKQSTKQKRSVCERKRCCATCRWIVTHENHECNKRFCDNCKEKKEIGHLCYMRPLKDALPPQVIRYCMSSTISRLH